MDARLSEYPTSNSGFDSARGNSESTVMAGDGRARSTAEVLRAREARIRAILNHTADGIVTIDEGKIDWFNRSAERLFGYSADEVAGMDFWSLVAVPAQDIDAIEVTTGERASGYTCEVVGRRKDGTTFPAELSLSEVQLREHRLVTVLVRDISERKRFEAERWAASAALREAKEAAERANRAKTDFLANMSHEIRTPLNAILGIGDLLAEARLDDELRQYVDILRRAGANLLALVNDILDLSKVEAHRLELEAIPFDIRECAGQAMEAVAAQAYERGLELCGHVDPDVPRTLIGDPTRVRQVLINLLSNAVKFTSKGEVTLRIRLAPDKTPNMYWVSVEDTGIGIPDHKLESVFDRFLQVDTSTTRTHGGTGLGLAICRGIVSHMNGRIWAEKRPGGGTFIRFTAHFDAGNPFQSRRLLTVPDFSRPVLIVDDHSGTCEVAQEILSEIGLEVITATSVLEGRAQIESALEAGKSHGLILVDARLPRSGGFDLLPWIAAHADLACRTVALVPADAKVKEIAAIRDSGLAGHVLKPLTHATMAAATAMVRRTGARSTVRHLSAAPRPERGLRILLVEDNPDNRAVVFAYLKSTPHLVTVAENGAAAVQLVKTNDFDLVLMDVQMPVMDGYEATRRIRAWEQANRRPLLPILALTAQAMKGEDERAADAGCDACLRKPIGKQALFKALTEHAHQVDRGPTSSERRAAESVLVEVDPDLWTLIPAYLEGRKRDLQICREHLARGDFERIRVIAHGQAGSGGAYGFQEITRIGRALEHAARESDTGASAKLLSELESYFAHIDVRCGAAPAESA